MTQSEERPTRIYVSYAWGDDVTPEGRERERLVDRLCEAARERGVTILRDRTALRTGDSIDAFMRRIGAGDLIFVFLSDKYLRSPFCMFELSEIWRNSRHEGPAFMDRVKLYPLPDANYRTPQDWVYWAEHWKAQHHVLVALVKRSLELGARPVFERMERTQRFYNQVAEILALLADRVSPRDFEDFKRFGFEEPAPPSPWASERGADDFGVFARITVGGASQTMRWIPPGTFLVGSPDDELGRFSGEWPRRRVTLSSGFWLFDTPCTQALWSSVTGDNPSRFKGPDRPVESVNWDDAKGFIERINGHLRELNLRLPTEEQWEYACRAGTNTATYRGPMPILGERNAPALDPIAWYGGNSGLDFDLPDGFDSSRWPEKQYPHKKAGTRPVRKKDPNTWGLYDMLGNVWEWCDNGVRTYGGAPITDYVGPTKGEAGRVMRGGSWIGNARYVRAACRVIALPDVRGSSTGFRCAGVQG